MTGIPFSPEDGVFREAVDLLRASLGEAGTSGGIALELLRLRAPETLAAASREGVLEVLLGGAAMLVGDALAALEAQQPPLHEDVVRIEVGELLDRPGVWLVYDNCSLTFYEHPTFAAASARAHEEAAGLRADGFEVELVGVGGGAA